MRRRFRRHLTCARVPNDLPACPVVIHRNSSPHSAFPRHVTRKLDSVRGRAEIASGWPAAPAGSSQQVSDLVPIIGPGLCTRGCPRDGLPRSCCTCRMGCWGDPSLGRVAPPRCLERPHGCPNESRWPARASLAGNARAMVHSGACATSGMAGRGSGGGDGGTRSWSASFLT